MKAHAPIGADILSRIEFPFPVVPIVRHHHENWDGSGYPDGLSGEAIPIGARILAVVDCYDALTSDRPYRRKMNPEDAMEIIRRRSGQMYDPSVVDAFVTVHAGIPPERSAEVDDESPLLPLRFSHAPGRFTPRSVGSDSAPTLAVRRQSVHDCVARMKNASDMEFGEAVVDFFANAQPAAAAALYRFDPGSNELVLVEAAESLRGVLRGVVSLGTGVTGWVASNRAMMANSDAALDFDEGSSEGNPFVRMCAAAPVIADGELAGVLSVYSASAFNEADRLVLEVIAEELRPLLQPAGARRTETASTVITRRQWAKAAGE
jgi:hypothetical protein